MKSKTTKLTQQEIIAFRLLEIIDKDTPKAIQLTGTQKATILVFLENAIREPYAVADTICAYLSHENPQYLRHLHKQMEDPITRTQYKELIGRIKTSRQNGTLVTLNLN